MSAARGALFVAYENSQEQRRKSTELPNRGMGHPDHAHLSVLHTHLDFSAVGHCCRRTDEQEHVVDGGGFSRAVPVFSLEGAAFLRRRQSSGLSSAPGESRANHIRLPDIFGMVRNVRLGAIAYRLSASKIDWVVLSDADSKVSQIDLDQGAYWGPD